MSQLYLGKAPSVCPNVCLIFRDQSVFCRVVIAFCIRAVLDVDFCLDDDNVTKLNLKIKQKHSFFCLLSRPWHFRALFSNQHYIFTNKSILLWKVGWGVLCVLFLIDWNSCFLLRSFKAKPNFVAFNSLTPGAVPGDTLMTKILCNSKNVTQFTQLTSNGFFGGEKL